MGNQLDRINSSSINNNLLPMHSFSLLPTLSYRCSFRKTLINSCNSSCSFSHTEWFLRLLHLQMALGLPLFHLLHQMRPPLQHFCSNYKHKVLQGGHLLELDSHHHHHHYRPFSSNHISINTSRQRQRQRYQYPHQPLGPHIRNRMRKIQGVADPVGMEGGRG